MPNHNKDRKCQLITTLVHRLRRKFQFSGKFGKFAATNCGSLALQKLDLVENFDLVKNYAATNFSTETVLQCFFQALIESSPLKSASLDRLKYDVVGSTCTA